MGTLLRRVVLGITIGLLPLIGLAQVMPVGSVIENNLRAAQLMGLVDSAISFTSRPLDAGIHFTGNWRDYLPGGKMVNAADGKTARFALLPAYLTQQVNTHHPYGWNDGAMIPANGYQVLVGVGAYAALGPLEVQLQPEFVYASNANYRTSPLYGSTGNTPYLKFFPGQSDIRLSAFSLSVGVSTANMWWGPGRYSSLLMSNNAPGFLHAYFRSQKPIKSPIGSFEWQLIGARLTSDAELPYENKHLQQAALPAADRYLSAVVFSYQPKWIPGLFVGITRALQRYTDDLDKSGAGFINKYVPVLSKAIAKQNAFFDDTMRTDQLASFFLRWAFFKAKAEFYVEWGYNDYGINARDYLLGPTHSAAYLVGFRKVFPRTQNKSIEFGMELTQMSQSPDWLVRNSGNWYSHSEILEGYTNQNQSLGSGAGFGANHFAVDLTWVNGTKRLGFLLERINRDPQYHPTRWVDMGIGVLPQWEHKQFVFSGKLELVRSNNYMWEPSSTVFNVHSRFIVQYHF